MGLFSRFFDKKVVEGVKKIRDEASAAAQAGGATATPSPEALAALPPCVRRYIERAAATAPAYKVMTAKQSGKVRFDPKGTWRPLAATQTSSPLVPALMWSASGSYTPLISMKGFDALVGGKGSLEWRMWGWLPVLSQSGGALDKSILARWLAETPGFPRAMLPSAWLKWEAVAGKDNEARATVTHAGNTASGIFTFDQAGLVTSFRTQDYVRQGSPKEKSSWLVRYRSHKTIKVAPAAAASKGKVKGTGKEKGKASASEVGMFVPAEADALWVEPDGKEFVYVQIKVEGLTGE